MNKNYLFTFILVLMMSLFPLNAFANENTSSTEISEENSNEIQHSDVVVFSIANVEQAVELSKSVPPAPPSAETPDVEEQVKVNESVKTDVAEESLKIEKVTAPVVKETKVATPKEQGDSQVKKLNDVKYFIKSKNRGLSDAVVTDVAEAALSASQKNNVELSLILAVMWKESTFNPEVYLNNCYGVMQIHQNTAAGFGYKVSDIKDPKKAAYLGSKLLKSYTQKYGSLVMGLTAYNQGTGNVARGNYNTRYANNVIQKQAVIQKYIDTAMKK